MDGHPPSCSTCRQGSTRIATQPINIASSDCRHTAPQSCLRACALPQGQQLVLPILGYLTVKCHNCSCKMKRDEMGKIWLVMDFHEAGNDSAFASISIGDRIAASLMGGMPAAVSSVISSFVR